MCVCATVVVGGGGRARATASSARKDPRKEPRRHGPDLQRHLTAPKNRQRSTAWPLAALQGAVHMRFVQSHSSHLGEGLECSAAAPFWGQGACGAHVEHRREPEPVPSQA